MASYIWREHLSRTVGIATSKSSGLHQARTSITFARLPLIQHGDMLLTGAGQTAAR